MDVTMQPLCLRYSVRDEVCGDVRTPCLTAREMREAAPRVRGVRRLTMHHSRPNRRLFSATLGRAAWVGWVPACHVTGFVVSDKDYESTGCCVILFSSNLPDFLWSA